jgi:hypothetical protein
MVDEPSVVERTGLVVLSQGEIVVPAAGSEAILASVGQEGLVLEFPVEIEVRIVPACDPEQHVETTLARLTSAIEGLA